MTLNSAAPNTPALRLLQQVFIKRVNLTDTRAQN